MSLLLVWLLMLGAAPLEGVYVAQHQGTATATALELEPDGRYRWLYSQGALDLTSEGKWSAQDGAIILTSDPVTPPSFVFSGASGRGDAGAIVVRVLTSSGEPIPAVEIILRHRSGSEAIGRTDPAGQHRFAFPSSEAIGHIILALPALELRSQEFRTSAKAGEILTFQIEPNDVGKQLFASERLSPTKSGFRLSFRGQQLDYERQEGGLEEVP